MSKNNVLENMLADKNEQIERSRGTLSKLFWMLMRRFDVGLVRWEELMSNYLKQYENPRKRSYERSNMTSALISEDMTWGTFVKKALPFHNVDHAVLELKVRRKGEWCIISSVVAEVNDELIDVNQERDTNSDPYFISEAAKYIFTLLHTDGTCRMNLLDVKKMHYTDADKAYQWYLNILSKITPGKCDHPQAADACDELTKIYTRMTGTANENEEN